MEFSVRVGNNNFLIIIKKLSNNNFLIELTFLRGFNTSYFSRIKYVENTKTFIFQKLITDFQ